MEAGAFDVAVSALGLMLEPGRLMALVAGVLIGLTLGVIPGLGGVVGMALLIPFTYDLDPYAAFGFLIGMGSVTTTSDTVPAVLFGVPGTVAAAATVMDGYPLAQQGQAGRAFGAAYTASLIGGLAGALLLALSIPILRPVILYLQSPDLLAICVFALSTVAALSGKAPLRGMTAAGLGMLVAMVGSDPQSGTLRWTFDALYLWDGVPLVPLTLGLFALPELAELAASGGSIAASGRSDTRHGQLAGIRDALRHWWLVLRCSWIGASLGAVPGLGSAVIDWIAYGHAMRTEKNTENFGKGDIRGVIAPESAANAKEGGSLVPTLAFGVPGSASMAVLLGAFTIHGLVPGPRMLNEHLDVTYSIVWSIALANVLGAGLCLAFSQQLARVASVRIGVLLPLVLAVIFLGAFQGSRQWGDLYVLFGFGALGWVMKRLSWPRAPLILGFVLGGIIERYLFVSIGRYQWDWLTQPLVLLFFGLAIVSLGAPLLRRLRPAEGRTPLALSALHFSPSMLFSLCVAGALMAALAVAGRWSFDARIVPQVVAGTALTCIVLSLILQAFTRESPASAGERAASTDDTFTVSRGDPRRALRRSGVFLLWCVGYLALARVFGLLPGLLGFVALSMCCWGRESLARSLAWAAGVTAMSWLLFDRMLAVPWPTSLIEIWFPAWQAFWP